MNKVVEHARLIFLSCLTICLLCIAYLAWTYPTVQSTIMSICFGGVFLLIAKMSFNYKKNKPKYEGVTYVFKKGKTQRQPITPTLRQSGGRFRM